MNKYIAGNVVEDVATFTGDDNITLVDPTTVLVKYQIRYAGTTYGPYTINYTGSTTPATGTVAKLAVGTYNVRIDSTLLPGYWVHEWQGTGTAQALLPVSYIVNPAPL